MADTVDHLGAVPSFDAHLVPIQVHRRRMRRRHRAREGLVIVALVAALTPFAVHEYRYRFGPASVDVVGVWSLRQVEHEGQPTVAAAQLMDSRGGVALQFTRSGRFQMATGCTPTLGDYRVATDELSFGERGGAAVACGYTTAEAERIAAAIRTAADSVLEHGGVVSSPGADRLDVSSRDGVNVLHYVRNTSPPVAQLLPS